MSTTIPTVPTLKAQWVCKRCHAAADKTDHRDPESFPLQRDWNAVAFWTLCPTCAKPYRKRSLKIDLTPEEAFLFERFCREGAESYKVGDLLTPEMVLQNFIRDFLGAAGNNGSDEREYADQWFQRTWMAFPKERGAR